MPVPTAPTIAELVTEGLKRAGIVNPSAGQITSATTHQFREVKADIANLVGDNPTLWSHSCSIETAGISNLGRSRYDWPTDAWDVESVTLVDGPDEWRGTAQAGGTSTITLAASFSESEDNLQGKWLFLRVGVGAGQVAQIVLWDNVTKIATVDGAWTPVPGSGTTYLIGSHHWKVWENNIPLGWDLSSAPYDRTTPYYGAMRARQIWFDRPFNRGYVVWWKYWYYLDMMDDASNAFLRFMRNYRSLWVQGIATYTMQRFDDDRFQHNLSIYNAQLGNLAAKSSRVGHVQYTD